MSTFSRQLLAWHAQHGRHDLPWQHDRTAYRVWVSEIMLQQTQVATVIPYFDKFIQGFPDISSLANAAEDEVLHLWTGLGYYARARNLHKAAKTIHSEYQGVFPRKFDEVLALPGIGRSTAGAILAQAYGERHVILDGNVKRVLTRQFAIEGWPGNKTIENQLWQLADELTPKQELVNYTQAIMDLGATVCGRKAHCSDCPVQSSCQAFKLERVNDFPYSKPRKALPVRETDMLVLVNSDKHILLEKRPPSGIWGGLWSLPEKPGNVALAEWCDKQLGWKVQESQQLDSLRHTFSHYHLDITPILVQANTPVNAVMEANNRLWYNTQQPEKLGLPAPVLKILKQINEGMEHG